MVLFVKLFAIMGLTWFTECVHIVLHDHDHTYSDYCNFYVEASDRPLQRETQLNFDPSLPALVYFLTV